MAGSRRYSGNCRFGLKSTPLLSIRNAFSEVEGSAVVVSASQATGRRSTMSMVILLGSARWSSTRSTWGSASKASRALERLKEKMFSPTLSRVLERMTSRLRAEPSSLISTAARLYSGFFRNIRLTNWRPPYSPPLTIASARLILHSHTRMARLRCRVTSSERTLTSRSPCVLCRLAPDRRRLLVFLREFIMCDIGRGKVRRSAHTIAGSGFQRRPQPRATGSPESCRGWC